MNEIEKHKSKLLQKRTGSLKWTKERNKELRNKLDNIKKLAYSNYTDDIKIELIKQFL